MKMLLLAAALFAASGGLNAAVIYSYDGPVTVSSKSGSFLPPDWPAATGGRMRLTFEAREREDGNAGKSGFWTFFCRNVRRELFQFYCPGAGFHYLVSKPSGAALVGDTTGKTATPVVRIPRGESDEGFGWSKIVFESDSHGLQATVDGVANLNLGYSLTPFSELRFSTYNRTVEIRNVKLETLPDSVVDRKDAPTLEVKGVVTAGTHDISNAVSAAVGGVMFWAKFVPGTDCVRLLGADGAVLARFYCCGDYRIQADVKVAGSDDRLVYKRRLFDETTRGPDDFHYAFTWDESGLVRFFLNGVPFSVGSGGDDYDFPIFGNALDGVVRVEIPSSTQRREGARQALRDLAVYRRPLANREVMSAYRSRMPVDLAFHDSVLKAGADDNLTLTVAPGGTYTKPEPTDGDPVTTTNVSVAVRVEKCGSPATALAERTFGGVDVREPVDLVLGGLNLSRGNYRALVTVTAPDAEPYVRTKLFKALPDAVLPTAQPSKAGWIRSSLLWSREFHVASDMPYANCTPRPVSTACGDYLECGTKGGLAGDRMGVLVDFPPEALGHPCLLEIRWPDDAARLMGFCMFLESRTSQHRDRLMAGVCAGDVLRTTGEMQKSSYLFYPSAAQHLFEVRTQADGRPAAIESLRVWRLAEPLPVLKVHRPEGYPHRRFGHVDEDQTFYFLLNDQYVSGMDGVTGELAKYFAYTGQDTFDYTMYRYVTSMAARDLNSPFTGYAGSEGELPYALRQFARAGIEFNGNMGLIGEPHIARMNRIDGDYWNLGFVSCDAEGYSLGNSFYGDHLPNMANSGLQDRFFDYCEDLLRRSVRHGLGTLRVPVTMLGRWHGSEYGKDAWSLARYHADTGREAAEGEPWLRWRADQVTRYFTRFVEWAARVAPGLEVRLILPAGGRTSYEENGVDVAALAAIPGVTVGFERGYTQSWFNLYRNGAGADQVARARADYGALYDANMPLAAALRAVGKRAAECASDAAYFETFRGSLLPDRFNSYFQSLDVKPWGRNFLREPAFMVATFDAQRVTVGGQPLGTLGSEEVTREFVQAYSALPAVPFADIPSDADGVVARSFDSRNGTYFYLVNTGDSNRVIRVVASTFGELLEATDLSSDKMSYGSVFSLRPYELRSFLVRERLPIERIRDADEADIGENAIAFGPIDGRAGYDYTNEIVRVSVAGVLDDFSSKGYALRLTLRDDVGTVVGASDRQLGEAGTYVFDTATFTALVVPGRSYTCEIALVNADGEELPLAQRGFGTFRTANRRAWFAVVAATDAATGGSWTAKPARTNGVYAVRRDTDGVFSADASGSSFATVCAKMRFPAAPEEIDLRTDLERLRRERPMAALGMREEDDGSVNWVGLVREDGELVFRTLYGLRAVCGREYLITEEVDCGGAVPRVSYLVESGRGRVRLHDAEGRTWFTGGRDSGGMRESVFRGTMTVGDVVGNRSDTTVAEAEGRDYATLGEAFSAGDGDVRLLTNATWRPDREGRWTVSGEGDIRIVASAGWNVVYRDGVLTSRKHGLILTIQ